MGWQQTTVKANRKSYKHKRQNLLYLRIKLSPKQLKTIRSMTYFGEESQKFIVLDSVYVMFTGKPIIKVQRIAVDVITELHSASLQSQSLPPLWLELPNKLLQDIRSWAATQSWPSLNTDKFDCIPIVVYFLFPLQELNSLQDLHYQNFQC